MRYGTVNNKKNNRQVEISSFRRDSCRSHIDYIVKTILELEPETRKRWFMVKLDSPNKFKFSIRHAYMSGGFIELIVNKRTRRPTRQSVKDAYLNAGNNAVMQDIFKDEILVNYLAEGMFKIYEHKDVSN